MRSRHAPRGSALMKPQPSYLFSFIPKPYTLHPKPACTLLQRRGVGVVASSERERGDSFVRIQRVHSRSSLLARRASCFAFFLFAGPRARTRRRSRTRYGRTLGGKLARLAHRGARAHAARVRLAASQAPEL
jgi:hypothetical protein